MFNSKKADIFYISPSSIPSKSANSIHVLLQCEAFSKLGYKVKLYFRRSIKSKKQTKLYIKNDRGINLNDIELKSIYSPVDLATSLFITLRALPSLFIDKKNLIISRNLYTSYLISVIFRRKFFFETHQIEYGFRKILQRKILQSNTAITIVISSKLSYLLKQHYKQNFKRMIVMPDAARSGIVPIESSKRRRSLEKLLKLSLIKYTSICGYFGHLYKGRGIELIINLAKNRKSSLFIICGGTLDDINKFKKENNLKNLIFLGYKSHEFVINIMRMVDILLMPYQSKVSIGVKGHDTSRWMSPMKMFEYLASGVPLISSNLPVLKEVLKHKVNSLLVNPSNTSEWLEAINSLEKDQKLANDISRNAHKIYKEEYTWTKRAEKLLKIYYEE